MTGLDCRTVRMDLRVTADGKQNASQRHLAAKQLVAS